GSAPPTSPLFPYTTLFRSRIVDRLDFHPFAFLEGKNIDAGNFTNLLVQRHQQIAETEHHHCDDNQLAEHLRIQPMHSGIVMLLQDRKSTRLNSSHAKISYA